MKVVEKYQNSNLINCDVKWYLFDEQLWITKCKDYPEVDDSIAISVGSFNLIYEENDTVLFNRREGRFETAIINLSYRINNGILKKYTNIIRAGKKGDLFFAEKANVDFNFLSSIVYDENEDILLSFPTNFDNQTDLILFIVDDFGFFLRNHQLQGWFLQKASKFICITKKYNKNITPQILARYLNALRLWEEEEDITELEILLSESKNEDNEFYCALRECIMNLLY